MSSGTASSESPLAILHDAATGRWLRFQNPTATITARRLADVRSCLDEIEQSVERSRLHAAGWIAYEAAAAFDSALTTHAPAAFPLLWFGLFEEPATVDLPAAEAALPDGWRPNTPTETYVRAFDRIKTHIRAGDTYQVNFTYRLLRDAFDQDPWQAFLALIDAQRPAFGAYMSAGPWRICSASPELFFRLDGACLVSRPMKGTTPRGLSAAGDRMQAAALLASEKNRAENLMIVDMVRNDMGRIARPGSIQVSDLCALEKFPTLWQLTSTVAAETDSSVADIFSALFPPASITGAPKKRTMEIIADLERSPRNIYTGAMGFHFPGRRAQFNVSIRTLLLDTRTRSAEYGIGGGIVWDSDCQCEQAECRTKARILSAPPPASFSLLETMLWTPETGFHLLARHLQRLRESADYFDFACDDARIRQELNAFALTLPAGANRLRLLLAKDGTVELQSSPLPPASPRTIPHVALARRPVNPASAFLYHKTTNRSIYEDAKSDFPDHDDVILFNENGQATESTIANLAVELDGILCTPSVECGLLPGTARAQLLAEGRLREQPIPVAILGASPRLFLFNSVRGLYPVALDPSE
jgi:para-aminobenzoate synthetase/4-amino-4-deoxychorismate lyase